MTTVTEYWGERRLSTNGYRNNRGEIDGLLLGPGGLSAIEGKHTAVTAHCRGDDWWGQRLDKYGNAHERVGSSTQVADRPAFN